MSAVAENDCVKFKNDHGLPQIGIGVKEFECIGASPPHDHPHIYHDMESSTFIHCLYCNTKYVYRPDLERFETDPPGNVFADKEAT